MVMAPSRVESRGSESGEARIEGEAQEKAGKGTWEELGELLRRQFLEFQISNSSIWCNI